MLMFVEFSAGLSVTSEPALRFMMQMERNRGKFSSEILQK